MLDYDLLTVDPLSTTNVNVKSKHFVDVVDNGDGAWQIEWRGVQLYTTAKRSYCLAPIYWGYHLEPPRCLRPYVALSACESVEDFKV